MPHISQGTRAILNSIKQLKVLEETLQTKIPALSPAENLKIKSVLIDLGKMLAKLETIAGRVSENSGTPLAEAMSKLQSEAEKRRTGQLSSSDTRESPVTKADGADLEGVMVALYPSPKLAKKLAIPNGEPAEQIHCTLLYFVDKAADRDDWDTLTPALTEVCSTHKVLHGKLAGFGRFQNSDSDVLWASPDVPGLVELRMDLLKAAEDAGFEVNKEHMFTPHLTLAYLERKDPTPIVNTEKESLDFQDVLLVTGNTVQGKIALKGA